jgi:hypothetical protein
MSPKVTLEGSGMKRDRFHLYASFQKRSPMTEAIVLCAPGAAFETVAGALAIWNLFGTTGQIPFPLNLLFLLLMFVLFIAAVATALISFVRYCRRPLRKPWYVWLNLFVNASGAIYAAGCLVFGLINGFGPD